MALSGSVSTTASHNRSLKLSWTATQNNIDNTSTINWTLKGAGSASGYIKVHAVKVTIDGSVAYNVSDANCDCYSGTTVASGTKTITHKSDGSRSFTVKVEAGIYNYAINCSGSSTFTLNTIVLGSTITSAANVTLGQNCQIKWTPTATSYYYKLKFALGNWSYTTGLMNPNQTTEYTYSGYTVPLSDVAQQIPNSKTGTMTAYLYTYSDSTASKQVGAASSKTFTVTIPDTAKPTLGNAIAMIDNSANNVVQSWGIAVAGFTKVRICAEASGVYGASINSFTLSGEYSGTVTSGSSLDYTGGTVISSGTKTFLLKANDSRGMSSEQQSLGSVLFYAYEEPNISSFAASRVYSATTGGRTTISVKGNWSYASVNGNNSATATLKYKSANDSSWTTYGSIPLNTEVRIECPNGGNAQTGFSELTAYDFKLEVQDLLSSKAESITRVPTAEVLLDFKQGGKGLGVGRVAESNNLEVAMDTYFFGDVYLTDGSNTVSLTQYIQNIINGTNGTTGT